MTARPIEGAFDQPSRINRRGASPDLYPPLPSGSISRLEPLDISDAFRDAVALIWAIFMLCAVAAVFGVALFLLFFVKF